MIPLNIFIAYSHRDEGLRNEIENHLALLRRQGYATIFHDRRILPGQTWRTEIDTKLMEADLILLLISSDFLASDYCYGVEMQTALERHEKGEAQVVPVILRHCDWHEDPGLSNLQALPKDAHPVTAWDDRDEALLDVAKGIRIVVEAAAPKPIPIELVSEWSPTAMVVARMHRILVGPLPRPAKSVMLVLPDQCVIGISVIAAVVVTDDDGELAAGVPIRLSLSGGAWGAEVGVVDVNPRTPLRTITGESGNCFVKIFPEALEVILDVEADGYPRQVGRFVAGSVPLEK